jgi:hypothetical protein
MSRLFLDFSCVPPGPSVHIVAAERVWWRGQGLAAGLVGPLGVTRWRTRFHSRCAIRSDDISVRPAFC